MILRWAVSFGVGTLVCNRLPELPSAAWLVVLIMLVLLLLSHRRSRWLVAVVLGFGWAWLHASQQLNREWIPLPGHDYPVQGVVAEFPDYAAGRSVFVLKVRSPKSIAFPQRLRLSWYDPEQAPQLGDELRLSVRLKRPQGSLNPGGFDFERWLFVNDIGATGYVREGEIVDAPGGGGASWRRLRRELAVRLDPDNTGGAANALLQALALGTRGGFEDHHWALLRRTGTSHLVAISGLHVGLVAVLALVLLRPLLMRLPSSWLAERAWPLAASGGLLVACSYAALAGFSLPTQRAVVMLAVGVLGLWLNRRMGGAAALGCALGLVLVWDPLATLSPGFWLSFVAVATLVQVSRVHRLGPVSNRVVRSIQTQWAVGIGLLPCLALFFGEVNGLAPWVNLIAIPWFSLVVVPVVLMCVLAVAAFPISGAVLLPIACTVCEWTWLALAWIDGHLTLLWPIPELPTVLSLGLLGAVGLLVLPLRLPARGMLYLALIGICLWRPQPLPAGAFTVTLLDVGQGLAVLVRTRHHTVIYDTGPASPFGFNAAEAILQPALRALGAGAPDLMILSHGDNDHAGGAELLTAAYPRMTVLAGGTDSASRGRPCQPNQRWHWDDVEFRVLYPEWGDEDSSNNLSCVVRVDGNGGSLLLTGDIERRGEGNLLASGRPLAATVVVVPHHGSNTSSSTAFVEAVGPNTALVAAGFENRWGFPKPTVVHRWRAQGAEVLNSGTFGAIELTFSAAAATSQPKIKRFRVASARYWRRRPSSW
jgi:competence protein ComEC